MKSKLFLLAFLLISIGLHSQTVDSTMLTLDRIFASDEFSQQRMHPIQWIEDGKAYVRVEKSNGMPGAMELVRYEAKNGKRSIFLPAGELVPTNMKEPLTIEDFSLSSDGSKVLIFNNSSRVWRSNTKGDYWVYDFDNTNLRQIGSKFAPSSLMFAKFSQDNSFVAYVHDFNIYLEDFSTGKVKQLTFDGNGKIINGTFDWVYEEEFGCRDGFRWSPQSGYIAFWQLDASETGTFYMINNTDSVYSKLVPVQYPKAGQTPSACRVNLVSLSDNKAEIIDIPGDPRQHYIPAMQWVDENLILIQQLNRKQNHLKVYKYNPLSKELKIVYEEVEDGWVDINYPDVTANNWGQNDLLLVDENKSFLRLSENDGWRHVYKINIESSEQTLLTPGDYDVATLYTASGKWLYFNASPENSTQRYLYRVKMNGKDDPEKLTTDIYDGINTYDVSPDAKYAIHTHTSALQPRTVRLINLPEHRTMELLVDNKALKENLSKIKLPEVEFFEVETADGIPVDVRMIKPVNFDEDRKYPILFHVYGEPWQQVCTDSWIGNWNIFLAQQGFIVVDMDNRGTPCLKGSDWRKSIYGKLGRINVRDQALAASEVLKLPFIDTSNVAVWGWSGGGSMTLNLMFKHSEIYKTGMSVAPLTNLLIYDNIYQERYMGLPQDNMQSYIDGSPMKYAGNLKGNLLIVHGTGDDNVHYQGTEMLINELVKENKQFDLMSYPNRSHGIYEGVNTTRHLYTLLTGYLMEHTK